MNPAKVARVLKREYVESVRKRSFLFGLVATPLMFAVMIALPLLSEGMVSNEGMRVAVIDRGTQGFGEALAALDDRQLTLAVLDAGTPEAELDAQVARGELDGWVVLPADFATTGELTYRSDSVTSLAVLDRLEDFASRVLAHSAAARFGLDDATTDRLLAGAQLRTVRIGGEAGDAESEFLEVYLRAVLLVMAMFFALIPTGHILLRSVIEEKSNRVIEVLLSSVSPLELMVGKILGLGAVGLTMLGTWTALGLLLTLQLGQALPVSAAEVGVFALYFLPGYFLFAALLGSIGAICSSERDAQPFLAPVSLVLMLPVMAGMFVAQAPDHLAARILSFFPPLTPSLMMFRYAIQPPPLWEIAATWVALLLATAGMFWASSRIFRTGILMTGQRASLPEIARWVRAG